MERSAESYSNYITQGQTVKKSQYKGVVRAGWGRFRKDSWKYQAQKQVSNQPTNQPNGSTPTEVEDGMCLRYHRKPSISIMQG